MGSGNESSIALQRIYAEHTSQYTPPTPTRRNCRVASRRRCEHNAQLAHDDCRRIWSTIWKLANRLHSGLTTWILIDIDNFFNNDDIMTSLLKKLSISIKIGLINRYGVCLASFQIVDRIRRQSSWASCEMCSHRRRRRDATRQFSRVGVGGVYWAYGLCGRPPILHQNCVSPCLKKNCAKLFLSELGQISTNCKKIGKKMAKRIILCEVHSFCTSPNLCQRTTVLNADVPHYITQ